MTAGGAAASKAPIRVNVAIVFMVSPLSQNESFSATWLLRAAPADEMRPKFGLPTCVFGLPKWRRVGGVERLESQVGGDAVRVSLERLAQRDVEVDVAGPAQQVPRRVAERERRVGDERRRC